MLTGSRLTGGALAMAQLGVDNGANTRAVTKTHNIVAARQSEIDQKTRMLEGR
jgi:uncharacterized protein (DUF305 family)